MKPWSYWFPDLLPLVPGCPNVIAAHELRRAAQVFCEQTKAWKVVEAARPVAADTETVAAAPSDSGMELSEIDRVTYDGKRLDAETLDSIEQDHGANWETHTGTPFAYFQLTPGEIRLYPKPVEAALTGIVFTLVVKPSDTATGIPDDLAIKYRDAFHVGAKARLMAMPGRAWSNPGDASAYGTAFDSMCGTGNVQAARSFGAARIAARPKWC